MLSLLLIILYTTLFFIWLLQISRKYRNYLSVQQVGISFIIKILFGFAYGFIFYKIYNGDDTWKYHQVSLIEYAKLLHHPMQFLKDFISGDPGNRNMVAVYDTTDSFWNVIDEALFIRMLAFFNVLSFGHYYVNVVLFCFVAYLGNLLLFRLFIHHFPDASLPLIIAIFYVPIVVFWLSGIRKEGIIFLAMSTVLYYFDKIIRKQPRFIKNMTLCLFGFIVLWLMRNLMVMCIAPALLAWFLCYRFKFNPVLTFTGVYMLGIIMFFISGSIPGLPDFAQKVSQRQYEFFNLEAKTRLTLDSLKGTSASYLKVLPQALNHSFLRPYLTESKSILQVISALDIIAFFAAIFIAIIFHKKDWRFIIQNPMVLTCIFTSFFGYLIIGYTVPFPGAVVRYKAIFELLFLCTIAIVPDRRRIVNLISGKDF